MVDITAISAIAGSLNATLNIAKATVGLRDAEAMRAKVLEMQTEIGSALGSSVSAQLEQLALIDQVKELKSKIADLEAWSAKKQRYELHQWQLGSFSYRLKDGVQPPELSHHLCATCFDQGHPSILQTSIENMYSKNLKCNRCSASILTEKSPLGPSPYSGRVARG